MSFDLYFWKAGVTQEPGELAEQLAEEEARLAEPDAAVLAFRAELLERWPELADNIEPWHHDLDWRQPWGRTDLADRYVILTLPFVWSDKLSLLSETAKRHGLDCYDPQIDQLT